jgi:hypothetical protein
LYLILFHSGVVCRDCGRRDSGSESNLNLVAK